MKNRIHIRPETAEDIQEIFNLNAKAFNQHTEAKLVDLLRVSDAFIPELSLVAILDDQIVGHILFTKLEIIGTEGQIFHSLSLAPMAVDPLYQRKGIGGELIKSGLDAAKRLGHSSVIVLGHPDYYPRFGFQPASTWHIQSPYEVPDPVFMAIELIEGGLEGVNGMARYPEAFNTV